MADAITALPAAPSRTSPSDFSTTMDAFLSALITFATECNTVAAALNLLSTTSTSTTSLTIGTGSKSLTVTTGKSYLIGNPVMIANSSSNWMHGIVTSYNSGTGALVVNVTNTGGSGTLTSWTITLSGPVALSGLTTTVTELNYLSGLTAEAAEINKLDGVTAGTVSASKALVVDADKRLDTLVIADSGLKLGTGSGTAITATAAKINAACANAASSLAASGYIVTVGGVIIQWGKSSWTSGSISVTWPTSFPTACRCAVVNALVAASGSGHPCFTAQSTSGGTIEISGVAGSCDVFWMAIGY